jgi:signal transduction histidine kinase
MVFRIIIALLIALAGFGVRAAPFLLHDLAVFEDKAGTLTIEAVAGGALSLFKPLPSGGFSGGYTRSTYWFRFTVAQAGETWLDIQPPVLDDLRLFEADPLRAGSWLERHAGDTLPFSAREVPARSFVLKLRHADAAPHTYYLRLATTSSAVLSARLMSPDEFIRTSTIESGLLMAGLAIAMTVALLSIHTWLWMRDSLTPWFIANLVTFALHLLGMSGFLQQYLFPMTPQASYYWMCVFSFTILTTFYGLYRRLFGVGRERPVLFWIYEANCWGPMIVLPLALSGWQIEVLPIFLFASIPMTCICWVLSFNLWRSKATGGVAMLLAMTISMAGIMIFLMHILGQLEGGFFVWHSLQFTTLGSELALYLALGARYRSLSEARVKAEQDAKHEHEERVRQGHFLAMLAHELRTSLTVLRMAVGSQPMLPKTIAKAERAMDSMAEVIDQSVQVERLADGAVTIQRMPCDMVVLVQAVIADSRDPARIRARLSTPLSIQTDGRLLRIVMSNLVDNALKYGRQGEPIDIELLVDGAHFCMVVSNAVGSAGLPDPQRVFEKYYRAPQAHAFTGSGLGLHIAAALARLLGGDLRYQPTNERVVFELRLQAIASFADPSLI